MISLLQVFRGLAALLVVYHHANREVAGVFGDSWLRSLFDLGDAGVQFFFVLSGFIIYHVHRSDMGRSGRARRYLLKRIIRIYPIYILVTLVLTPFWAFIPAFGAAYHKELSSFIYSILLIPQSHLPNLGVAWTLTHEVMFYLLFALLIVNRRIGSLVLVIWFVAIGVVAVAVPTELTFPLSFVLSINNLLFGLGIVAALMLSRSRQRVDRGLLLVALGSVAFMLVGVGGNIAADYGHVSPSISRLVIFLLGLASFVIVLQSKSGRVEQMLGQRKILNAIGAASFLIYLIHQPVISLFRKIVEWLGWQQMLGGSLFFVFAIVVSVIAGWAMYQLLERPMLRYFTKRYAVAQTAQPPGLLAGASGR